LTVNVVRRDRELARSLARPDIKQMLRFNEAVKHPSQDWAAKALRS
jgi:hypothetical protein